MQYQRLLEIIETRNHPKISQIIWKCRETANLTKIEILSHWRGRGSSERNNWNPVEKSWGHQTRNLAQRFFLGKHIVLKSSLISMTKFKNLWERVEDKTAIFQTTVVQYRNCREYCALLREAHRFWRGLWKPKSSSSSSLLPPPPSGEYNRFLRVTTDVSTRSFPTRRFELCDFQFLIFFEIFEKKNLQNLD